MHTYTEESVITVRGLQKHYGTTEAVAGIDLDVRRGEVFAFLGPNGAGKTTTVEILEGFRKRSACEVRVLGIEPAHGGAAWRYRVGCVRRRCTTGHPDEAALSVSTEPA
jgi:ABC-2 type transport system ATP-binding protein